MRKALVTTILAGVVSVGAIAAAPIAAQAAEAGSGPTSATFQVNGGALNITAPSSANLGAVNIGATNVSSQLGTVTVTDQRASLSLVSWTTSVVSTPFTATDGTNTATIAASNVSYLPGLPTAQSGVGVFAPGLTSAFGIGTSATAYTAVAEVGSTSVSWNPTVTIALPANTQAGTYNGTITHSVA
jgi:hypothetical protein